MTTQQIGTWLLYFAAPAANLFPVLYALSAPWHRSAVGRAIVTSKVGLALLVDAAVIAHFTRSLTYPYHDQLVLFAFALIAVGTWMYLGALTEEQIRKRRRNRR